MDTPDRGSREGVGESGCQSAKFEARGSAMFWVLIALAAAGFAPCVLLPIWRDYQAMALAAQAQERLVASLRADVERQRRALAAIRTDRAVGTRLAQRELAYRRAGQVEVRVPGVAVVRAACQSQPLAPVEPPDPISRLSTHLPTADYDHLFCQGSARTVIMLLSGGLTVAAFLLYSPRSSVATL
ncbi:MAG: hypothetical protein ACYSVY_14045 [Planctomycetota bacterium]